MKALAHLSILAALVLLSSCRTPSDTDSATSALGAAGTPTYQNLGSEATYVGKDVCKTCHAAQYETFIEAEMGRSFANATLSNSAADFENAKPVYDRYSDLYYLPFAVGEDLYLKEYKLSGRDTVYKRIERIDYIVGSGQHTNSHIMDEGGYLYQMPLTWYAQDGRWDLPPGFEDGNNSRFSRPIPIQCMTCHNGMPEFVEGSENRYTKVLEGIDCERCHGPGSIHVEEIRAGRVVNVADTIDYSIVNPAKLPIDRQFDICQNCHMQGVSVYKPGMTPMDFRPGRRLIDVQNVFWPRYADSVQTFKMASHPDRLKMSSCFRLSHAQPDKYEPLTCITCHDPHVGVKAVGREQYNQTCQSCHTSVEQTLCTETVEVRAAVGDNCVACHMPTSGSEDIPHVRITDHYVRRPNQGEPSILSPDEIEAQKKFIGLASLIEENPSPSAIAEGYLDYYEQITDNPSFLDSAIVNLERAQPKQSQVELARLWIWAWFRKQDYASVARLASALDVQSIADAWTWFRVGKSFQSLGRTSEAVRYLELALDRAPQHLRFSNELAGAYEENGQTDMAVSTYNYILESNPKFESAYNDRGYTWLVLGDLEKAEADFLAALELDPNGVTPLANLASVYYNTNRATEARPLVRRLLALDPGNPDYRRLWELLQ